MSQIFENVSKIKQSISGGNGYGEKVLLVAATKMQTVESINESIRAGVDAVAENKVQEFRDKHAFLEPCPQHFIGHLQTNKVKYLIGKIDLYHSCDRDTLADEIARLSVKNNVTSSVLMQVNISKEESKGGYDYDTARESFLRLLEKDGIRLRGFMAMLPESNDGKLLVSLVKKMRELYEWAKDKTDGIDYLSMGMSGDYALCVEHGSNVIRVGSTIFGARNYSTGEKP